MRRPDPLLATAVARLLQGDALRWDIVNGVGFLRARLSGTENALRSLHVFDPSLRAPDLEDSGAWHDHRFALRSVVLLGAVHDVEVVSTEPSRPGQDTYQIHEVSPELDLKCLAGHVKIVASPHVYEAGATYQYPANKFHRTEVKELTVTICTTLGDVGGGGRLLARSGNEPTNCRPYYGAELFEREHCRALRRRAAGLLLEGAVP